MNWAELLQKAKKELELVSSQAYQESLWILSHTLNLDSSQIYLENKSISPEEEKEFWKKINQRKQAFPLEYILKEKFFFGHKFYIEKPVFIPRMETETLLKWVFKNIPKKKKLNFIDFGAGVGTIALSLLHHFPDSLGLAVEINPKAISCLKKNSINLKLKDKLYILKKDVSKVLPKDLYKLPLGKYKNTDFYKNAHLQINNSSNSNFDSQIKFDLDKNENFQPLDINKKNKPSIINLDLITANPPYIDIKDNSIQPEVYLYESPLALFSDKKGLGHIISWFETAMKLLKPNGLYIFEFGWNQEEDVIKFLNSQKQIDTYTILKDQLGHPRIAVCFKKAKI